MPKEEVGPALQFSKEPSTSLRGTSACVWSFQPTWHSAPLCSSLVLILHWAQFTHCSISLFQAVLMMSHPLACIQSSSEHTGPTDTFGQALLQEARSSQEVLRKCSPGYVCPPGPSFPPSTIWHMQCFLRRKHQCFVTSF